MGRLDIIDEKVLVRLDHPTPTDLEIFIYKFDLVSIQSQTLVILFREDCMRLSAENLFCGGKIIVLVDEPLLVPVLHVCELLGRPLNIYFVDFRNFPVMLVDCVQ